MAKKVMAKAVSYLRTSSAANVGADKSSDKRQRSSIAAFAKGGGYTIVDEFYDAAVSGADPIEGRPGFAALLARIDSNGVRVVLIDEPSRFARDLVTQELGVSLMIQRGVRVICANGDDLTTTDDPMRKAMRQIAGAFSELEKSRLVAKLADARARKRKETGRCEGRKPLTETHAEAVAMAKRLAHGNRRERLSLRQIAKALSDAGHVNTKGKRFDAKVIKTMLN